MRKKLTVLFVVLIFLVIVIPTAFAEETQSNMMAETSKDATTAEQEVVNVLEIFDATGHYVTTQSFSRDHFMIGLFSESTESFNTGEWDILDAEFTLSFSTTQIVSELLSDITISINGVRFYTERIPVTDGLRRERTVKIPIEHIVEGYNIIRIEGYLRTYDGLPCVDDVTAANWMNIFKESYTKLIYDSIAPCSNISEFYKQFTSIDALENNESVIVIGTNYDTDELDAALTTLAGISRNATLFYENIAIEVADNLSYLKDKKYVIFIAKPDNLPDSLQSHINSNNVTYGQADSEMMFVKGDTNILIVTGATAGALDNAAAILSDKTTMYQLRGTSKIVDENEDIYMRKEGVKQYTQITETGTYLKGTFRQTANYFIDFPQSRKLAYGSEVSLNFRYAENLDFDRSLISIYINNVPLGSQKLSQARAENDTLTVTVPTDIDVAGSFTLTIAFDLEIKDLWCTLRQTETPWAYITKESMLKINSVDVPYFLFENYPYPFITAGEFDALLIIPDDNLDIDITLIGDIMKTIGQFLKYNTGDFSVARASDPGKLNGKNIITIGTFNNNNFISQLNDELFFKFYSDGSGIRSNEKLLIEQSYGSILGSAQFLLSPYSNTKNALLAITSSKNSDLSNATNYFSNKSDLWKLYGDGFVADADEVFLYRFKEDNAKKEPLSDKIAQRANLLNFVFIAGSIVLILLIAIIFLLIKYKRRRNDEK